MNSLQLFASCSSSLQTTPVEPELRAEWLDTAVRGLEAFKCSQVVPEDEAPGGDPGGVLLEEGGIQYIEYWGSLAWF